MAVPIAAYLGAAFAWAIAIVLVGSKKVESIPEAVASY